MAKSFTVTQTELKSFDMGFELYDRPKIRQAAQQLCQWDVSQISYQYVDVT